MPTTVAAHHAPVADVVGEPERSQGVCRPDRSWDQRESRYTPAQARQLRRRAGRRVQACLGSDRKTRVLTHAPLNDVIPGCKPATMAAENLSKAAASPAAVIDAWMHSPGHKSNLLDATLTEIGVGCVVDGRSMLCSQVLLGP
jgi:Cysteine-rich secretory protein family